MKKIKKLLFFLILIAIVYSLAHAFYKTVIKEDFSIVNIEPIVEEAQ